MSDEWTAAVEDFPTGDFHLVVRRLRWLLCHMNQSRTIYTIGHSSRPLEEFLAMLQSFDIGLIADIRSLPGSRKYPHFDKEELQVFLPQNHIQYVHLVNLGGRRRPDKNSKNTGWRHRAFRGYADYMETDAFTEGMDELKKAGAQLPTAYMCSEAVWWRCHRAMVSDSLKVEGWTVLHIMDIGKAKEHPYTAPAKIIEGRLSYEGDV